MRCPLLRDLPRPPAGKTGWPWTVETSPTPETMPDGSPWPRISIVTPSFNQGRFLEETIRSVLLQGYPNLEYLVVDGGSTDESAKIIRKYERWLAWWTSEPDRGQSHALNKGFVRATGEVFGWLNSDDYYTPGALTTFARLRNRQPASVAWVGSGHEVDVDGKILAERRPRVADRGEAGDWNYAWHFVQPACLFSADAFRTAGGLDEVLEYAMDVDLWVRLARIGCFATADETVACARIHPGMKSLQDGLMQEAEFIAINYHRGAPEVARRRLERYSRQREALALDVTPAPVLLRRLASRLVRGVVRRLGQRVAGER